MAMRRDDTRRTELGLFANSHLFPVTRQKARFDGVKPVLDGGRHASPNLMRRRARKEAASGAGGATRQRLTSELKATRLAATRARPRFRFGLSRALRETPTSGGYASRAKRFRRGDFGRTRAVAKPKGWQGAEDADNRPHQSRGTVALVAAKPSHRKPHARTSRRAGAG